MDACYVHVTGIEGDERSRAVMRLQVAFLFCYLVIRISSQLQAGKDYLKYLPVYYNLLSGALYIVELCCTILCLQVVMCWAGLKALSPGPLRPGPGIESSARASFPFSEMARG